MKGFIVLLVLLSSPYCFAKNTINEEDKDKLRKLLEVYYKPIEKHKKVDTITKKRQDLGRMLFYDKRLSFSKNISCNDCHDLKKYGTNGEYYLNLIKKNNSLRDVPSIYNKTGYMIYNWDGSHKKLTEQIKSSLLKKSEMGNLKEEIILNKLRKISGYSPLFKQSFPEKKDSLTFNNLVSALSIFVKGLQTPAPIDRFLEGDNKAINEEQVKGAYLFDKHGCSACHTGSNFGGQMLQKLDTIIPWPNQKDTGYFGVSKNPQHKMVFRVSPLRNVSKTGPYFHDRSSKYVWRAIRKMSRHLLGNEMNYSDTKHIHKFFDALTGELPEEYIKIPEMPK